MILSIIIALLLFWYIGYATAFHMTIDKMVKYEEPFNKMDIQTVKQLCKLSWLWVIILIMDYYGGED